MGQPDAIIELRGEHHLLLELIQEIDNLLELMRDLPGPPDEEIVRDLIDATDLLNVRMRALLDEEERLIFPAIRRHFRKHGRDVKQCEAGHNDLRLSLTTLYKVIGQLESQWRNALIEQAWALVDHIGEVFQQHSESELVLFDRIDGQLTLAEHRNLVNSLRMRRNIRIPVME